MIRRPLEPDGGGSGRPLHGAPGTGETGAGTVVVPTTTPRPAVTYGGAVHSLVYGRGRGPLRVLHGQGPTNPVGQEIEYWNLVEEFGQPVWRKAKGRVGNVVYSIAEAPLAAVHFVWRDKARVQPSSPGHGLDKLLAVGGASHALELGTTPNAWPYLSPVAAAGMAWRGLAQFRAYWLAMPDGRIPALEAEATGRCVLPGETDAFPPDVVVDLLTTPRPGWKPLSASQVQVDLGPDGTPDSSFRRYCTAAGWRVARWIDEPTSMLELLESLLEACNATAIWSEGRLKVIPLESRPITANGVTYTPPVTAVSIDDNEIERTGTVVEVDTVPHSAVFNRWPISIRSRESQYREVTYWWPLAGHVAAYGPRTAEKRANAWIVSPEHAVKLSQLLALRSVYSRLRIRYRCGIRWGLLEPGDTISFSHAQMGLSGLRCRIAAIDGLGARRTLRLVEDPDSVATPVDVTPQAHAGVDNVSVGSVYVDGRAATDLENVDKGGANLIRGGSFESDVDGDGIADFWGLYSNLPDAQTVTMSRPTGGLFGGVAQMVAWSLPNTTTKGIYTLAGLGGGVVGGWIAGRWYTLSFYAKASLSGGEVGSHYIGTGWNTAPTEWEIVECPVLSSEWQRYVFRYRWATTAPANGELYLTLSGGQSWSWVPDGATGWIAFDAVSVTEGRVAVGYAPRGDEVAPDTSTRARNAIARPTPDVVYYRGMSTGPPVLMDPAWTPSTAYSVGVRRTNAGNVYRCTAAGTSAPSGGPTGTGSSVTDGSCSWAFVGTIADEERVQILSRYQFSPTGLYVWGLELRLRPRTDADNLDGIRYAEISFFTASGGASFTTRRVLLPDRRYEVPGSPTDVANVSAVSFDLIHTTPFRYSTSPFMFAGWARVSLRNALGSAARDFGLSPNTIDGLWPAGTIPDIDPPGPPSGDGGGGGECPAPDTPILLPGGVTVPAGALRPGDLVWTRPEHGAKCGAYRVSHVSIHYADRRLRLLTVDGRELVVSPLHRVAVPGGWAHVADLEPGRLLEDGGEVERVDEAGAGEVVRITVEGARTYVAADILSHNLKPLPP